MCGFACCVVWCEMISGVVRRLGLICGVDWLGVNVWCMLLYSVGCVMTCSMVCDVVCGMMCGVVGDAVCSVVCGVV